MRETVVTGKVYGDGRVTFEDVRGVPVRARINLALLPSLGVLKLKVNCVGESPFTIVLDAERHLGAIGEVKCLGDGVIVTRPSERNIWVEVDLGGHSRPADIRVASSQKVEVVAAELELEPLMACPFHSQSEGVALEDVAGIVRLGNRQAMQQAINKLDESLSKVEDLDEAKGLALMFLAIVAAARLETGGSRNLHQFQLIAAREIDKVKSARKVAQKARQLLESVIQDLFDSSAFRDPITARAHEIIDRSFARNLTDNDVAEQLGLSTSHFRSLFRASTGKPFHQYLLSVRLEKSKKMLEESGATVSDIARWVGFKSTAHFSRAFQQRFKVPPSTIRNAHRT